MAQRNFQIRQSRPGVNVAAELIVLTAIKAPEPQDKGLPEQGVRPRDAASERRPARGFAWPGQAVGGCGRRFTAQRIENPALEREARFFAHRHTVFHANLWNPAPQIA